MTTKATNENTKLNHLKLRDNIFNMFSLFIFFTVAVVDSIWIGGVSTLGVEGTDVVDSAGTSFDMFNYNSNGKTQ